MTIDLGRRPELEEQLIREAAQQGVSPETYVLDLLGQAVPDYQANRNAKAIKLVQSWIDEGDEEEQRETFEALREGLNANHSSDRLIFP